MTSCYYQKMSVMTNDHNFFRSKTILTTKMSKYGPAFAKSESTKCVTQQKNGMLIGLIITQRYAVSHFI